MAWVKPVYDRTSGEAKCSHTDMTRIVGDINIIMREITSSTYKVIDKESFVVSDIVTKSEWTAIVNAVKEIGHYVDLIPTNKTTWQNFNNIEKVLYKAHNLSFLHPALNLHPNDDLYPAYN